MSRVPGACHWQQRFEPGPLGIGQVGGIGRCLHTLQPISPRRSPSFPSSQTVSDTDSGTATGIISVFRPHGVHAPALQSREDPSRYRMRQMEGCSIGRAPTSADACGTQWYCIPQSKRDRTGPPTYALSAVTFAVGRDANLATVPATEDSKST